MDAKAPPYIIAIGASGGEGIHDIIDLLGALPQPMPAVVMVVCHRPSDRISSLRGVLARGCDMPVVIAEEAEELLPGICYIGEPDGHLTLVSRSLAHLVPGARNTLRNRTIDTLFNSVALYAGERTIGVIMSGSLDDGSRGLAAIHHAHGFTMVLEPGHKPIGMQRNAIDYDGPISFVGSAREIAEAIGRIVAQKG